MLIRVLLFLCAIGSGLAWFTRVMADVQNAFKGENAVIFLTMTVALGLAAVAEAVDHLRSALEEGMPRAPHLPAPGEKKEERPSEGESP